MSLGLSVETSRDTSIVLSYSRFSRRSSVRRSNLISQWLDGEKFPSTVSRSAGSSVQISFCDAASSTRVLYRHAGTSASWRTVGPTLTRWVSPPPDASNQPRRSFVFLRKTLRAADTKQIYEIPGSLPLRWLPGPWITGDRKIPRRDAERLRWTIAFCGMLGNRMTSELEETGSRSCSVRSVFSLLDVRFLINIPSMKWFDVSVVHGKLFIRIFKLWDRCSEIYRDDQILG